MTRSVSATEAKARLGDLMKWAVKTGDDVIIQSRGYPQVAIVPFKEYEELKQLKERARRAAAMARLQELAREVQAQNEGITLEEADVIAEEISSAAIDQLATKGIVKFERDDMP